MNFTEKVPNGYYREDHQNPMSMGMVIPSSSSSSSSHDHPPKPTTGPLAPPNFHYYYNERGAEGTSRSTPPELDLMDASPNHTDSTAIVVVEREHMFDKVVTPSDVGKLNRLVIPKQHAEKYFPLDSSSDNKQGLLLNFEDSNGKSWRFRYSYWNSSQSYVMTKGWSRFVKDKKLDAGDIVSFHRGLGHQAKDRLFIHWRRRPPPPPPSPHDIHTPFSLLPHYNFPPGRSPPVGWGSYVPSGTGIFLPGGDHRYYHGQRAINNYPTTGYNNNVVYGYTGSNNAGTSHDNLFNNNSDNPSGNSVIYFRPGGAISPAQYRNRQEQASREGEMIRGGEQVLESVPVVQGKAAAKRLRLFGVNMDCPIVDEDDDEEDEDQDITVLPSTTTTMVLLPH